MPPSPEKTNYQTDLKKRMDIVTTLLVANSLVVTLTCVAVTCLLWGPGIHTHIHTHPPTHPHTHTHTHIHTHTQKHTHTHTHTGGLSMR